MGFVLVASVSCPWPLSVYLTANIFTTMAQLTQFMTIFLLTMAQGVDSETQTTPAVDAQVSRSECAIRERQITVSFSAVSVVQVCGKSMS